MYVTGTSGSEINEYTLTTAFDVSTASYRDRFAVGHAPMSVKFNDDGTCLLYTSPSPRDGW